MGSGTAGGSGSVQGEGWAWGSESGPIQTGPKGKPPRVAAATPLPRAGPPSHLLSGLFPLAPATLGWTWGRGTCMVVGLCRHRQAGLGHVNKALRFKGRWRDSLRNPLSALSQEGPALWCPQADQGERGLVPQGILPRACWPGGRWPPESQTQSTATPGPPRGTDTGVGRGRPG